MYIDTQYKFRQIIYTVICINYLLFISYLYINRILCERDVVDVTKLQLCKKKSP